MQQQRFCSVKDMSWVGISVIRQEDIKKGKW
jgi:hypothetical protein